MSKSGKTSSKIAARSKLKKYSVCPNCGKRAVLKRKCHRCGAKDVGKNPKKLSDNI